MINVLTEHSAKKLSRKQKARQSGLFKLGLSLRTAPSCPAALMAACVISFIARTITITITIVLRGLGAAGRSRPTVARRAVLASYTDLTAVIASVSGSIPSVALEKLVNLFARLVTVAETIADSASVRVPNPVQN